MAASPTRPQARAPAPPAMPRHTSFATLFNRLWPLPALLAWSLAWAACLGGPALGLGTGLSMLLAVLLPWPLSWRVDSVVRRWAMLGGFPVSWLLAGSAAGIPGWAWGAALAVLLLLYPVRAWRDAPLFPTTSRDLDGLADAFALPPGARVLDAGCGLGDGLRALHACWPQARIAGCERSLPLAWAARWRCGFADVQCADMWSEDWAAYDVVYLFQRPETMDRAWRKACAQMRPGSWLVSLEFEIPAAASHRHARLAGGRGLHVYRVASRAASRSPVPPGGRAATTPERETQPAAA